MRNVLLLSLLIITIVIGSNILPTSSQQTNKSSENDTLYPPNAKPGECYARVKIPEKYETYTEEVVKRQASEKIEIVEPKFELVDEKVLVKDATFELKVVPAKFEWVEEKVLVKPAYVVLEDVPAEYGTSEEKVLVKPAQTVWKKGRGPIEKIDGSTGEILCLIEEPAVYKTVSKKVLKTPAKVVKKEVPAEYKVVKKKIVKTPPSTQKVEIPAEYTTIKVRKQVQPATEKRIPIPEEKQTITKTKKVADGKLEWKPILCETNMTVAVVKKIQVALTDAGFYNGPIDGVIGGGTIAGLRSYQSQKGLATGGITIESLNKLGVQL
ncbi:MAG: peptidoglycan-binding domain-containing protein [Thermodesulfobacteriota bacterium]